MYTRKLYSGVYDARGGFRNELKAENASLPTVTINQNHTFVIQDYDHDLKDYLNRHFPMQIMCKDVRATGYEHVWYKQTKIPHNTTAVDPKLGIGTDGKANYKLATLDSDYGRGNPSVAYPRMHITGIEYTWFDTQMEMNYGAFNQDLIAKDLQDMFVDYTRTIVDEFWNGEGVLSDDTKFTYQGILNQITDISAIPDGTRIARALQSKIAQAAAQTLYIGSPNVLAMNPVTYDLLCEEEEKNDNGLYSRNITTEIIPGVEVPAIRTQAGILPIILTPFIKIEEDETAKTTSHKIVAINTNLIDRVWLFFPSPLLFVTQDPLNPIANPALVRDKNLINIDTYILHGAETPSHFILTKTVKTGE